MNEPVQTFASVWDALEGTPAAAAGMRVRSELMMAVLTTVETWGGRPAKSATRLGLTRSRFDELLRGQVDGFRLDELVDVAERAGLGVHLDVNPRAA